MVSACECVSVTLFVYVCVHVLGTVAERKILYRSISPKHTVQWKDDSFEISEKGNIVVYGSGCKTSHSTVWPNIRGHCTENERNTVTNCRSTEFGLSMTKLCNVYDQMSYRYTTCAGCVSCVHKR